MGCLPNTVLDTFEERTTFQNFRAPVRLSKVWRMLHIFFCVFFCLNHELRVKWRICITLVLGGFNALIVMAVLVLFNSKRSCFRQSGVDDDP